MTALTNESTFLDTIYNEPHQTASDTFQKLHPSLFVSSRSPQSRIEAFLKEAATIQNPTHDLRLHDGPGNDETCAVGSGYRVSDSFVVLENEEQIQHYALTSQNLQAFFIRQRNSYSPLSLSLGLYEALAHVVEIPHGFVNHFLYFGDRDSEVEIAPAPLEKKIDESTSEWMYNIRFVERNNRTDVTEPSARWSLRQSAIYLRYDPRHHNCKWVFITLPPAVQETLKSIWRNTQITKTMWPLHVHVAILRLVISNWRPFIVSLNEEVEQHAVQLLGASPDNRGPLSMSDSGERHALLILENKVLSAQLAVNATKNDLGRWQDVASPLTPQQDICTQAEIDLFRDGLSNLRADMEVCSVRLEHLRLRLQSITNLVSSFLDLSNGFALQELAKESRAENEEMLKLNARMHVLAEKTTQDAAALKVLTILTLIYLPVTVVSNFFSTSFVGTAASSENIFVTGDWWILVVTSVPLTMLTLYIWWCWSNIQAYQRYPWWWTFYSCRTAPKGNTLSVPR